MVENVALFGGVVIVTLRSVDTFSGELRLPFTNRPPPVKFDVP